MTRRKETQVQEEEVTSVQEIAQVEVKQPLTFNIKLQAHRLYEIIRIVDAVAGYGKEKKEDSDLTFHISNEGISLKAMDSARISMIDFELKKFGFDLFDLKGEGDFCFDSKTLLNLLKGVRRESHNADGSLKAEGDMAELNVSEESMLLTLTHTEYSRQWRIAALMPETQQEPAPTPTFETAVIFKIEKSRFHKILTDAYKANDAVEIEATAENVLFKAKGEIVRYQTTLTKGMQLLNLEAQANAKAKYNIDFLKTLLENLPREAQAITFKFSTNKPCIIETDAYDRLNFFLAAPRIED